MRLGRPPWLTVAVVWGGCGWGDREVNGRNRFDGKSREREKPRTALSNEEEGILKKVHAISSATSRHTVRSLLLGTDRES